MSTAKSRPPRNARKPGTAPPAGLQVEYRSLAGLLPYTKNSRKHSAEQVARIANSIREFGWTNPVLIDTDGVILAGHARVRAAKQLRFDQVPCIVLKGLSPDQKRALVIADNQLQITGGSWDADLLKQELGLLATADFNLDLLGFAQSDLTDILGAAADTAVTTRRRWVWQPVDKVPFGQHVELFWKVGETGTGGVQACTIVEKDGDWEYWSHGGPERGQQYQPPNGERPTMWRRIHFPAGRDVGV